jgi:7-cyano-7-deazaguanine reductase
MKSDNIKKKNESKQKYGLSLLGEHKTALPSSPDRAKLESFPNPEPARDYFIKFDCPEFTSLCPITSQPDFAKIVIEYVPDKSCLESKSLKLYLGAFRNSGTFHEAVVNRILNDIYKVCKPRWIKVTGFFNARGGIAISVVAEKKAPSIKKGADYS